MASNEDDTALSRSGSTSTGGKLTSRLDIPITSEMEEAVIGMAMLAGIPKAEYVRQVLEKHLFGEVSMIRRMTRAPGTGPSDQYRMNA